MAFIVAIVVLSPWALRNKTVLGDYSLTHSEGMMMEWHYWSIQRYRTQHESEKIHHPILAQHVNPLYMDIFYLKKNRILLLLFENKLRMILFVDH